MEFDPNTDDMEAHLALLYDWTQDRYPGARFEVRCLHPDKKSEHERYDCTPDGYMKALFYAVKHNDAGYNVYVTANPLKPHTNHAATDDDVEIAIHHFADADGVDDLDGRIAERSQGLRPKFCTLTGTVPKPRSQIYWLMSEPVTDMAAWRAGQVGLAQHLGTDEAVKNPSRFLRLAGTVSYPFPHKQARGYVTEVTSLQRTDNDAVCGHSFAACFSYVEPLATKPERTVDHADGHLPLYVIEAALTAIPPIMGAGKRNIWLDIAQACRDANVSSFHLFDVWQRGSDRYDNADSKGWPRGLRQPSSGSWLSLFRHAKLGDPDWWQRDPEVWEWWCLNAALHNALNRKEPDPEAQKGTHKFYGVRLRDLSLDVEPRPWVYGNSLIRGMLSALGGSGGEGKSSYCMTVLVSIAAARALLASGEDDPAHHIYEPSGAVMYYSLEDPMEDLIRQVKGILLDYNINPRKVWDNLILQSGRDLPLTVVKQDERGRLMRCDIEPIVRYLVQNNVTVATVDPFANSFDGGDGSENSQDAMKIICDQWRSIAHRANCAVWLVHHFRKGGVAGDADAFRGSSMFQTAARVMETFTTMTKEQAQELGIEEVERRRYKRLENAKANLSPASEGQWYRFNSVPLGNRTEKYPNGDIVGVVRRWKFVERTMTVEQVQRILDSIEQGHPDGTFFTSAKQGAMWAGCVIEGIAGYTPAEASKKLNEWLKSGLLTKGTYKSPKTKKDTEKLEVDAQKRAALIERLTRERNQI